MSVTTQPPAAPPKKRSGLGCLGCGCLVLVILGLLIAGLVGGVGFFAYQGILGLTSATPATIAAVTPSDDVYNAAQQKIAEFNQDVQNHQPSSLQLSADEINALIAHNPDTLKNNIQAVVTMTGTEGRVQGSLPTDKLSHGFIKGRYFNFDISFGVDFDSLTKTVNIVPHSLELGNKLLLDPNATADQDAFSKGFMKSFTPSFNQSFNEGLRENGGAALLDQTKTVEIKDGQLDIETQ